jgi:putative addiction module component (TIGR02574 family)
MTATETAPMTASAILEQALRLSDEERLHIYEVLLESLPHDDELTAEQGAELKRRIEDHEKNPEEGVTLEEWRKEVFETRGLVL